MTLKEKCSAITSQYFIGGWPDEVWNLFRFSLPVAILIGTDKVSEDIDLPGFAEDVDNLYSILRDALERMYG